MKNIKYNLRVCTKNDIYFIFDLKKLCLKWYIDEVYGWDDATQLDKTKKELDKLIEFMRIISVDGKDIGITTFIEHDNIYNVGLLMIHPEYQNKGIATNILKEYINIANKDKKKLILRTYKHNPAKRLYERLGFKVYDEDNINIYLKINFENNKAIK